MVVSYGNCSGAMKLRIRSSTWSTPISIASAWTIRSTRYTASVIRNEQRYATPPGALFVYTALTFTCAASRS